MPIKLINQDCHRPDIDSSIPKYVLDKSIAISIIKQIHQRLIMYNIYEYCTIKENPNSIQILTVSDNMPNMNITIGFRKNGDIWEFFYADRNSFKIKDIWNKRNNS